MNKLFSIVFSIVLAIVFGLEVIFAYQIGEANREFLTRQAIELTTETIIPPVAVPVASPVKVNGETCWLDANPEFEYTGNQANVWLKITCGYAVMEHYMPAREAK